MCCVESVPDEMDVFDRVFGMFREMIVFMEEVTAECGNINKGHTQQASLVPAGYKEICPYTCANLDYTVS